MVVVVLRQMDLLHSKQHNKMKSLYMDGFGDTHYVIIRLNHTWVLKLMARAAILALIIVSLPWINTIIRDLTSSYGYNVSESDMGYNNNPMNLEFLPHIFHDLANEGLLRTGDRSLYVSNGNEENVFNSRLTSDYNIDLISFSDLERQSQIHEGGFDFVLACELSQSFNFVDRALKVGGVVLVQLSDNPMVASLPHTPNYKVVYIRKFDSIVVAMRKTTSSSSTIHHRKLCNVAPNAKELALKKLEDVLLEPPRSASGKSTKYVKRTRYLPDLMGIPLESYPRRVFVDVSNGGNALADPSSWFSKHYPTKKDAQFEMFKIEMVTKEQSSSSSKETRQLMGMPEWLMKNVKENDYVVMKAEAGVVEEMVNNKAIRLVDELFMECKHQGNKHGDKKNRRAYWECLSLYGILRDEGVAVHQWWG